MLGSMVRTRSLALLLAGATLFAQAPQQGNKPAEPAKQAKPAAESLEDVINQALKNNPDIRVAEAKVREAEANLNKTRIAVAQKAVDLSHSINVAKKTCEEAKQRLANINNLHDAQAVAAEEARGAKLTVEKYEAELAKLEAELAGLLGKMPGRAQETKVKWEASVLQEKGLQWLITRPQADRETTWLQQSILEAPAERALSLDLLTNIKVPQGTMADKIRKALETPITMQIGDKTITDLMPEFQKLTGGEVLFRNVGMGTQRIVAFNKSPLDFKGMPLATVLQAIADDAENKIAFVVRDYGILAVASDEMPPGALRVDEFMKGKAIKDKPASGATEKGKK